MDRHHETHLQFRSFDLFEDLTILRNPAKYPIIAIFDSHDHFP
jgi:hypothetical protein